jgi:CBS domain-containing protein/sporulation protein YlmC with PRC-barrel domain
MTAIATPGAPAPAGSDFQLYSFSELLERAVSVTRAELKIGKLTDLVFRLAEPYPEAVGIFIDHKWGTPSEFVPWERVQRVESGAVIVLPPDVGERYPPFVDQPGWILLNEHLMGRTILDMDGRRVEVVNDVQLLLSHGRMVLVHVDVSFNGFLRKWGLGFLRLRPDRLISWKYVQPLSIEDATTSDKVTLSLARAEMNELPSEDLADALEEVSGQEQEAIFSVLDAEKAAETLLEAEPRAQRQIIEDLPPDRARSILSEMTVAQIADLLSALPWDDRIALLALVPKDQAERVRHLLGTSEATAGSLISSSFVAMPQHLTAVDALSRLRASAPDTDAVTYLYVVTEPDGVLLGVVDLRELVLASESTLLEELMVSPAVSADSELVKEDVIDLFAKYHYRLLPVVDAGDRLLGVVGYKDIMR